MSLSQDGVSRPKSKAALEPTHMLGKAWYTWNILRQQHSSHVVFNGKSVLKKKNISHTPPWRIDLFHTDGGISCNSLPQKYFHCIMIPKAEEHFRQTHPRFPRTRPDSLTLPFLKDHNNALTPERKGLIQQYPLIHTANMKGKSKFPSHSNTSTQGAIHE